MICHRLINLAVKQPTIVHWTYAFHRRAGWVSNTSAPYLLGLSTMFFGDLMSGILSPYYFCSGTMVAIRGVWIDPKFVCRCTLPYHMQHLVCNVVSCCTRKLHANHKPPPKTVSWQIRQTCFVFINDPRFRPQSGITQYLLSLQFREFLTVGLEDLCGTFPGVSPTPWKVTWCFEINRPWVMVHDKFPNLQIGNYHGCAIAFEIKNVKKTKM